MALPTLNANKRSWIIQSKRTGNPIWRTHNEKVLQYVDRAKYDITQVDRAKRPDTPLWPDGDPLTWPAGVSIRFFYNTPGAGIKVMYRKARIPMEVFNANESWDYSVRKYLLDRGYMAIDIQII